MVPANMVAEAFANTFTPMCLFLIWFGTIIGIIFGSIPGLPPWQWSSSCR